LRGGGAQEGGAMLAVAAGIGAALIAPQYAAVSLLGGSLVAAYTRMRQERSKSRRKKREADESGGGANGDREGTVTLQWQRVSVAMKTTRKHAAGRVLLDELSGEAKPGRLLAILGPSGAGKSTLLDALAGRVPDSGKLHLFGDIRINGAKAPSGEAREQAYLVQEPTFFSQLTVRETITFAAKTSGVSAQIVEDLISKLGLSQCAESRVGAASGNDALGSTRGISGGERKRLALACELLGAPHLIFADEPTSGLDSFQAERVMKVLRSLADEGHTVICTVHQPSERIYDLFDDVLLLAEGGRAVYHGEAGDVASAYFAEHGEPVPPHVSYPEHFLQLITIDRSFEEDRQRTSARVDRLARLCAAAASDRLSSSTGNSSALSPLHQPPKRSIGVFAQAKLLLQRAWRQITRDKRLFIQRMIPAVMSALTFGWIYWRMGLASSTILDRMGLLQVACINSAMLSLVKTLYLFPVEKSVVHREQSRGAYATLPYLLSKLAADLPVGALFPTAFGSIVYKMCGLQSAPQKMLTFLSVLVLESFTASAMGLAVGAAAPSVAAAVSIGPNLMTLFVVFGGYYVNAANIPWVLRWLPNVSMIRWAFQALALNEFDGLKFDKGAISGAEALTRVGITQLAEGKSAQAAIGSVVQKQLRILGAFYCLAYSLLVINRPTYAEPSAPETTSKNNAPLAVPSLLPPPTVYGEKTDGSHKRNTSVNEAAVDMLIGSAPVEAAMSQHEHAL